MGNAYQIKVEIKENIIIYYESGAESTVRYFKIAQNGDGRNKIVTTAIQQTTVNRFNSVNSETFYYNNANMNIAKFKNDIQELINDANFETELENIGAFIQASITIGFWDKVQHFFKKLFQVIVPALQIASNVSHNLRLEDGKNQTGYRNKRGRSKRNGSYY